MRATVRRSRSRLARLMMVPARRAALMAVLSIGCIEFRTNAVRAAALQAGKTRGQYNRKPGRR
ncbi:Uncharacterised protein [Bordetella pertussis]|nr:Uncharacterised protein [Bordetella pertussis]